MDLYTYTSISIYNLQNLYNLHDPMDLYIYISILNTRHFPPTVAWPGHLSGGVVPVHRGRQAHAGGALARGVDGPETGMRLL